MRFEYSHDVFPFGLIIPVHISAIGKRNGKEIKAKIDTGADISAIPEELQEKFRLKTQGYIYAKGLFDTELNIYPTFFITLSINNQFCFDLEVISSPREYFLIGRDLLNQIILYANGPSEFFELKNEKN